MSQAELARRIHVSLNTLNKIEAGTTPDPRASRIKAIAEVLGVSTDLLLGRQAKRARLEEKHDDGNTRLAKVMVDVEDW
jgi:transcriptional regulator with XRE-family HTH domain